MVKVVAEGYHLEFTALPPLLGGGRRTPTPSDPLHREVLEREMHDLQKEAVVRTTGEEEPLFRSSSFLAPKKDGSWRMKDEG